MKTYTIGTKVVCDFHFGGKPKGKVEKIITPGNGQSTQGKVLVRLTETVGDYKRGELLEVSTYYAVPVAQELRLERGQYFRRINTQYQYQ